MQGLFIKNMEGLLVKLPKLKIASLSPRYPIVQGGMAIRLSTSNLASTVANAGGIGLIAATGMSPDELRGEIANARRLSKGVIGINIMFASNDFELLTKVAIEEKIDLIVQGAGFSRDIFKWCKDAGIPFVPIVSSGKLAATSEKLGASAVVAEGKEAGGHLGTDKEMFSLLEEVVASVNIPVIAAGGIVSSDDMKKAFALGASGVQMGTIFVASKESNASDRMKEVYLKAGKDDIVLIDSPVGLKGQAIRNEFTEKVARGEAAPKTCDRCLKRCSRNFCIKRALINAQEGNLEEGLIFSGGNVDHIKEILPAAEIIKGLLLDFEVDNGN